MMEMDNGWVEVPAVHEPIVGTRFATKNVLRLRRTKRVRVELQRPVPPLASPFSLSIGFHTFQGLAWRLLSIPYSSRRPPKEVSRPMSVERVYDDSSAGIASATTLCDVGQVQRQWCHRLEDHREACLSTPWELVDSYV